MSSSHIMILSTKEPKGLSNFETNRGHKLEDLLYGEGTKEKNGRVKGVWR